MTVHTSNTQASLRLRHEPQTLDCGSSEELHGKLAAFNHVRLTPSVDTANWERALSDEQTLRMLEIRFVEAERAAVRTQARTAPSGADEFVAWFETLKQTGPGQDDPLFPWLAEHAPLQDMVWFLKQEMAGEAGFDDLVALTQVRLPTQAKLELARNYWDEMGQGHPGGMHGPLLTRLSEQLGFTPDQNAVWESLALSNLMVALAANRLYTYQSLGALGVIEMTAPWRAERVNAGLKRLKVGGEARRYYALHATLDVKHSVAWNREVFHSLVAADPSVAQALAEGALMRLRAGERCFRRYRYELRDSFHESVPSSTTESVPSRVTRN